MILKFDISILKMGNFSVEVIDFIKIQSLSKKSDSLSIIRIVPLRYEKGVFFVNIINFKVKKQKKQIELINQGGIKIKYKYNNERFDFFGIE